VIKDRICKCLYQYHGYFFKFTVYVSFKHTFSVALMLNFSFLEFFVFLGSFCFFCLPFCHPVGGSDSLKKRKIHQEFVLTLCIFRAPNYMLARTLTRVV